MTAPAVRSIAEKIVSQDPEPGDFWKRAWRQDRAATVLAREIEPLTTKYRELAEEFHVLKRREGNHFAATFQECDRPTCNEFRAELSRWTPEGEGR